MARVKDIMTKSEKVPKVALETSVLEAANLMNEKDFPAVAVIDSHKKVVGFFGERTLLREFVRLNKRPDEVKVGEIMHMLHRITPDARTREAAREIVDYGVTRLAVYDGDKFVGWVSLSDLADDFSRKGLLHHLRSHDELEAEEVLCPNCKKAFMEKVTDHEGNTVRWQCPNCKYAL